MSSDLTIFSRSDLKDIVQDMRDLLSQKYLSFLIGAGCSKIAGLPLMPDLTKIILSHDKISKETKKFLDTIRGSFSGARFSTIEDYMSEIVDFLSIAERRLRRGASQTKVHIGGCERDLIELQNALDEIKQTIACVFNTREVDVSTHQKFIKAVHNSLQAGKAGRRVDYFILNYDTLIEDALGLEQVAYFDGFSGAATGWWEPSTFNMVNLNVRNTRVFKVHGSIDWCLFQGDPIPRRVRSGIKTESDTKHILIYPAATKYQETQRNPFAQMLSYMRQSLNPDEGREMVLAICGYSFGDSHIDLEIENALYQSDGRLTIVAFVSTDRPEGKLSEWLADVSVAEQVRVYANKGYFHGDKAVEFDDNVQWWQFEILARLLGGER
jgi:hypothetical protein